MKSKVSFFKKIRYGIADIGLALQQSMIQFFMLFYLTDVAKINPGIAGTALLVGKLTWDIVNDPLVGYLSDRTKSRWGRRRPYMFFSAVPLALTFWLLFSLPQGLTGIVAFLAAFGAYILFDTFHTMVQMTYYAMSAELTSNYDERTSIASIRSIFSTLGYILGAAATTMVVGVLRDSAGFTEKASWSYTALAFGVVSMLVVLITSLTVRSENEDTTPPVKIPVMAGLKHCLKNKPYRIFILFSAVTSIGFALITALLSYYLIYYLDMANELGLVMLVMLGTVVLFIFPTKKVADKLGKAKTYAFGLLLASLSFIAMFFLPKGPTPLIYLIAFISGIGLAGQYVFPGSMLPDVIEIDEMETGQRREGIFFGIWAMTGKITGALAIALAGWALAWSGYVEGIAQSDATLLGIRIFFSVLPALLFIAALPMLFRYPITRESHASLVKQLETQKKGGAV
jgi:GPH family glycoside/pentoside/hexuronide:cation symporter